MSATKNCRLKKAARAPKDARKKIKMNKTKNSILAALVAAILSVFCASLTAQAQDFQPNPASPYPTTGGNGKFYLRSFNNPQAEFAPSLEYYKVDENIGLINFTYRAARRDSPGKPKIFMAFTNWLTPGQNSLFLSFNWNASWTTDNMMVIAEGLPTGSTGATFLIAKQKVNGVEVSLSNGACLTIGTSRVCAPHESTATAFIEKDNDGLYTESVVLDINLVAGCNALAFVGRPTNTDSCPTCEFGATIGLLQGSAEARPMLGDSLAWIWRIPVNELWRKLQQNARHEFILDPWTGRQVNATGWEVQSFLRTVNPFGDELRRTMNAAILSQLICLANNLNPDTTQVGQKTAADPEAWRSSADDVNTVGETVLTGACSVTSFALRVRRAYTDFQFDYNDRADFMALSRYLAQW